MNDALPPGPLDGLHEHGLRHLLAQGPQFPQEAVTLDAWRGQNVIDVGRDLCPQGTQPLFLPLRTFPVAPGLVPRSGVTRGTETGVLEAVRRRRGLRQPPARVRSPPAVGARE